MRQDWQVSSETAAAWDRFSATYQDLVRIPPGVVLYGPDVPSDAELRLLGDLRGKRVLELGCGAAQAAIAFAKAGATAIGVDFAPTALAAARAAADSEEVKLELRLGDMADLAFLRADSIDLAFCAQAFQYVADLNRVFRQVHRVLKVGAPLVFSLPHPSYPAEAAAEDSGGIVVRRSYFDRGPWPDSFGGEGVVCWHHSFSDLYMGLVRSSYRVDLVLEPEPNWAAPRSQAWQPAMELFPRTLIIRARKEGN